MFLKMFRLLNRRYNSKPKSIYTCDNPEYSTYDIGEYTYGTPRVITSINDGNLIIGKFCSIASQVTIFLGSEHRTDWITTYPFNVLCVKASFYEGHPATKGDIRIGNDVWIGEGACILSGVTIGDGSVIGTRALISKDVSPYTIVAGNPQHVIRARFPPDIISELLMIRWWDWPLSDIEKAWPLLMSSNINDFVNTYSSNRIIR